MFLLVIWKFHTGCLIILSSIPLLTFKIQPNLNPPSLSLQSTHSWVWLTDQKPHHWERRTVSSSYIIPQTPMTKILRSRLARFWGQRLYPLQWIGAICNFSMLNQPLELEVLGKVSKIPQRPQGRAGRGWKGSVVGYGEEKVQHTVHTCMKKSCNSVLWTIHKKNKKETPCALLPTHSHFPTWQLYTVFCLLFVSLIFFGLHMTC